MVIRTIDYVLHILGHPLELRLLLLVIVIDAFKEAEAAVTSCCDRCFSGG